MKHLLSNIMDPNSADAIFSLIEHLKDKDWFVGVAWLDFNTLLVVAKMFPDDPLKYSRELPKEWKVHRVFGRGLDPKKKK